MGILTVLGSILMVLLIILMIIGIVFAGVLVIGLTASMLREDKDDKHD